RIRVPRMAKGKGDSGVGASSPTRAAPSGGMPSLLAVPPLWSADLRNPAIHAYSPLGQMQIVMMPPAEQGAIVRMRGSALGVLIDVMHFAPGRRDGAAGDDASTVAKGDGAALEGVEDSSGGAQGADSAVLVEQDALNTPLRTRSVPRRGSG